MITLLNPIIGTCGPIFGLLEKKIVLDCLPRKCSSSAIMAATFGCNISLGRAGLYIVMAYTHSFYMQSRLQSCSA